MSEDMIREATRLEVAIEQALRGIDSAVTWDKVNGVIAAIVGTSKGAYKTYNDAFPYEFRATNLDFEIAIWLSYTEMCSSIEIHVHKIGLVKEPPLPPGVVYDPDRGVVYLTRPSRTEVKDGPWADAIGTMATAARERSVDVVAKINDSLRSQKEAADIAHATWKANWKAECL
jgi:hypothetical protein